MSKIEVICIGFQKLWQTKVALTASNYTDLFIQVGHEQNTVGWRLAWETDASSTKGCSSWSYTRQGHTCKRHACNTPFSFVKSLIHFFFFFFFKYCVNTPQLSSSMLLQHHLHILQFQKIEHFNWTNIFITMQSLNARFFFFGELYNFISLLQRYFNEFNVPLLKISWCIELRTREGCKNQDQ